jgi:hypothetical protein
LNITFGKFGEEDEDPPIKPSDLQSLKDFITSLVNTLKLKNYREIYVAGPHQCYSQEYEPRTKQKDILEIYFYSLPDGLSGDFDRIDQIVANGNTIVLREGQKDSIKILSTTASYKSIEDDEGRLIALIKDNQMWVLCDLLHNVGTSTEAQSVAKDVMRYIVDIYFNPPTEVELRKRAAEKIDAIIEEHFGKHTKDLEQRVKSLTADLQERERQLAQSVRNLAYESEMLDLAKRRVKPNAEQIMRNMEKMPFVKKIYFKNGVVTVDTKPINIGPFEYGSWTIQLTQDIAKFTHEVQSASVRHPYEYEDHRFCMGGFERNYALAVSSGEFDKALTICRLEITNYSTETRQKPLEDFLKKIMGTARFNKVLKEVREEKFPDADGLFISKIGGATVTFIATKKAADGHEVPTVKSVEINYAE